MKREHRRVVLVAVVALAFTGAAIVGCAHPQRRTDWRNAPRACASDSECSGGKCTMELGASQGTCTGGGALPPLPPGDGVDGGTRAPGPGPSIQPSSSDIQI